MGLNLAQKIIKEHLISGKMESGNEITIKIDQTLTQDATGTIAYLELETLGIEKVKTRTSVAYIDHNTLQTGFENADDHRYTQSIAKKYGINFSRPGNGICHQVHLERFAIPTMTLLGSDSHTPTCGGLGMLAIGAGGSDVAVAMASGTYCFVMPKTIKINLEGELNPWISAKDIILEILKRLSVKGGVGNIIEYSGEGIKILSVPQRATITNMGAELGATTSIFPSDEVAKEFLRAQGREDDWSELLPDKDAIYDEEITINLSELEPLAAKPHSPDKVEKVTEIGKIKVDQVVIGSCTNSSFIDMMKVANVLKGKTVHPEVNLVIAPGSKQVITMLAKNGALGDMVDAGARVLESACGPCIGMGQAPKSNAISLRTFNRNFEGRSGTLSAKVYLVSPEVAVASAITGVLTDPRQLGEEPTVEIPSEFIINDNMIIPPTKDNSDVEIVRGPNIKPFPTNKELQEVVFGKALIKVGDNITTDHITPSNAKLLPFRSNIPYLAQFCLTPCDKDFPKRAIENKGGFIIAGSNYGQGSSREHAALIPLQLRVKGVLAKSFARIHRSNLINSGIIPMTFVNEDDYNSIEIEDELVIENAVFKIKSNNEFIVRNKNKNRDIKVNVTLSERQIEIILSGGLLNYTKKCSMKNN